MYENVLKYQKKITKKGPFQSYRYPLGSGKEAVKKYFFYSIKPFCPCFVYKYCNNYIIIINPNE